MSVPTEVVKLVEQFRTEAEAVRSSKYKEAWVRRDYLDPFFTALGWDVAYEHRDTQMFREVILEDTLNVEGATKAPDYCFYVRNDRKFFVEAKKPSVNLLDGRAAAFQVRRYAWSAKLPLSVLTDFEELAVYDCRIKPKKDDKASTTRDLYMGYEEYPDRWDEIASLFSKEAVLSGSLDAYAQESRKKGVAPVDQEFLKEMEGWREMLAKDFALRNPSLTGRELNYAVQMTIDRIVFLRICEDRGIEEYGNLEDLLGNDNVYDRLCGAFEAADDKYNSGLFHFRKERGRNELPDDLTLSLRLADQPLKKIIKGLYYPESPYQFSVMPVEIMGQVYEQFLGKVISVDADHRVDIEEKPEVRKAGGVYYTPSYIVDYIVKNTVGKLVEGKTPRQVSKLRILDPACGSGSFLIGAYDYLLEWHRRWYVDDGSDKHAKLLYEGQNGEWQLNSAEKKRILLNNIHGVDIDAQAVEVTKLSLLLRVLEGETNETVNSQLTFFKERALPDLDNNIKWGNSLIGPDLYENEQMMLLDEEEHYRINVFDWKAAFPEVFSKRNPGFDAVIGNPPYGADYKTFEKTYFQSQYVYKKGKPETYIYFLERGIRLLADSGSLGYITPNAWLTNYYGVQIRRYVFAQGLLEYVVDLEPTRVFQQAVVDTAITVLCKSSQPKASQKSQVWRGTKDHQIVYQFELEQRFWEADDDAVINLQATPEELMFLTQLEGDTESLDSLVEYSQGVIPYKTKADGNKNLYISQEHSGVGWVPLIERASQVRRYELDEPTAYIQYGPWLWCARDPRFFSQPKILFHRLRKKLPRQLVGALDETGLINRHSLSNLILRPNIPESTLLAVLGLFNSTFANWWFVKKYGLLMEVGGFKVAKLPLPRYWDEQQQQVARLVEHMLSLHEKLSAARIGQDKTVIQNQINATDRQIDRLVYELYGLSEDEIGIIEA